MLKKEHKRSKTKTQPSTPVHYNNHTFPSQYTSYLLREYAHSAEKCAWQRRLLFGHNRGNAKKWNMETCKDHGVL